MTLTAKFLTQSPLTVKREGKVWFVVAANIPGTKNNKSKIYTGVIMKHPPKDFESYPRKNPLGPKALFEYLAK